MRVARATHILYDDGTMIELQPESEETKKDMPGYGSVGRIRLMERHRRLIEVFSGMERTFLQEGGILGTA